MKRRDQSFAIVIFTILFSQVAEGNELPVPTNFKRSLVLSEGTPVGQTIMTLTAMDSDGPSPLTFDTASPQTAYLVSLTPARPAGPHSKQVDVILKVALDSDFEPHQRKLYFKVSDGQNELNLGVSLFITDVNDCLPQFQNLPDSVTIDETTGSGTSLYQVKATDPDGGNGGVITFSLQNDFQGTFSVDRYYGKITLNKALDFESKDLYRLLVNATDGGGLSSQGELRVVVEDVQDSPPSFLQRSYSAHIAEHSPPGTLVVTVSAVDGDFGMPNSITYHLDSNSCGGYFSLDTGTGAVTVSGTLDREDAAVQSVNGVCDLNITATETSTHLPQNGPVESWVTVTVYVDDINDHTPHFSTSRIDAWASKSLAAKDPIAFLNPGFLTVKDEDQSEYGNLDITLSAIQDLDGIFTVFPKEVYSQAQIVVQVLNSTALKNYPHDVIPVVVKAREKNNGAREAAVTIDIHVSNVTCGSAPNLPFG